MSKYFARLYTIESDFYGDINRDLGTNKIEKYIPFIKILYEGVKLEALGLASDKFLYRGSKIAKEEIENDDEYEEEEILYPVAFAEKHECNNDLNLESDEKIKCLECGNDLYLNLLEKDDNFLICTKIEMEKLIIKK